MESSTANLSEKPSTHTKRNRIQLSCTPCRHAKLKCDRTQPCSQCQKKDRTASCVYPAPAPKKKAAVSMQKRLKHLESLVKDVMHSQVPGPQTPPRDNDPIHDSSIYSAAPNTKLTYSESESNSNSTNTQSAISGQIHFDQNSGNKPTTYVGATHWAAILDDIEEVKDYFDDAEDDDVEDEGEPAPDLVFNIDTPIKKSELLAVLPSRKIVDVLVAKYFNGGNAALHVLHRPTFQKEYIKFWANPYGTPTCWLGLLFGIMCLSQFTYYASGEVDPDPRAATLEVTKLYRRCCIQSLKLSGYTKPGRYTIETLLVHLEGEFVLASDDQMDSYLLLGVAVRLALRMGLHRDPDKVCATMTPFEKEMRRRLWHLLKQIDMLGSFHIGLPSMVESIDSDTLLPRNLNDTDFDEDTTILPTPRPDNELTNASYLICKSRICQVFGKIAAHANSLSTPSYDEVLRLDKQLSEAYANVPPRFQLQSLEASVTDPPQIILFRFNLGHLFRKSRCVLHRKYLVGVADQSPYEYSIKVGLEASMELLSFQSQIFEATRPGGPLAGDRCFPSSLLMHDYLLASMIVYMRIMKIHEAEIKGEYITPEIRQQKADMISALKRASEIWKVAKIKFADSRKASDVVSMMLKKILAASDSHKIESTPDVLGTEFTPPDSIAGLSIGDEFPIDFNADVTSGIYTDPYNSFLYPSVPNADPNVVANQSESFEALMDIPDEFNWALFDSHLRPLQNYSEMPMDYLIEQENLNYTNYNL